jgi:hypothetical protein
MPERFAMNDRIRQIVDQITALEVELNAAMHERGERLRYRFEDKRVVFEKNVKDAHQRVKMGVLRWIVTERPQNFITMPIIYSMVVPMFVLDLFLFFYQWTCFSVYGIGKVKRADYFVLDHQHLAYLNFFEKGHCMYCSYAVGLMAYATEIIARTEQYFCPIKHASNILSAHSRYGHFISFGDSENYHEKLEAFRRQLAKEAASDDKPQ